ncbi:PAS domain-containing protein [Deinococcus sp. QL22]|uniref:PAS domain-containing protein n=1 Tax=Deinococcus sp. QL22 TaxID=2939437 RepID=UPI0020174C71|nr:PAS domain-containing protein [Deinococcus sp. QL22]UQN09795.1 PAS domain S-box protein [Deinococcus sp. QL22]
MLPFPSSELRSLTDTVPHLWCTADSQGQTLWGNRAWHAQTSTRSVAHLAELVLPDDLAHITALWASPHPTFELDLPLRNAAGQYQWFRLSGQRQVAVPNTSVTWVITGINIHDLKEEQHQRKLLQDLVDASPNCIKVLDLDARLLSMNAGGQATMEIDNFAVCQYLLWPTFWEGEARTQVEEALDRARQGQRTTFEARTATFKGTLKWWEVSVAPLYDARGRLHQLSAVSRDITSRRTAQDALTALDAFVSFTKAVGTETDRLTLIGLAMQVLRTSLVRVSSAYYELEGEWWKAQLWSEDIAPDIVTQLRGGVPKDAPNFAAAAQSKEVVLVNGWDAGREHLSSAAHYGAVALLPTRIGTQVTALLTVGTDHAHAWTEREQAILRAVGHGLDLALERAQHAEELKVQHALLDARTRAFEGFAALIQDLALETDAYSLIRCAQEAVMSLLPDGYALYYERAEGLWRNRVQTGILGTPSDHTAALQATIEAGFPYEMPETLTEPWETGRPYYQDQYNRQGDVYADLVEHVNTVASLPVRVHGRTLGILVFAVFPSHPWTPIDKAVMETVVRSLGLALERAQGIQDLARASRFNELILSNVGEGLTGVDLQGRTTFANPAALKLLGYTETEFVGQPQHPLIHHTHADGTAYSREACPVYAAFKQGQAQTVQGDVFWRKDGTSFPVEYTSTPIRSETGKVEGAVLAFRDITHRRQAEAAVQHSNEELRRSNAELEQFAYIASHDLQAPIRAVASFAGIIDRKYGSALDDRGQLYLQQIIESGEHMKRLVDDLLAFSRVHTERREPQATDANTVFDQVVSRLQTEFPEANLTRDPLPRVLADPHQLDQLLQNLISNGLKYRREGTEPQVQVSAEQAGSGWRFAVQDNGIGIESQYFERIFEIFQRLHGRETYQGTGIGLAVCKKIVERHGGQLWLESTPGQGSTFFFTLPRG